MEISLLLFWLLLLGAAACFGLLRYRPALAWPTTAGLTGLTLLIWLIIRPQLPLEASLFSWADSGILPDWTWHIGTTGWRLTAWLLLLSTAVSLHTTLTKPSTTRLAPTSLLLTAAALSAIWSDSFTGLLAGLTLLLASWFITLWLAGERKNAFLFKGASLLLGLMLAWPIGSSRTALLGAALLLNIWPLPLWQPRSPGSGTAVAALTSLLPPLAGSLLLLRLLSVAELSPGISLLLTALGLVGFMQAVRLAWGRLHLPSYAVAALLLAQSHLLLLSAIWVGATGVVAELRVLLLAGGTLTLLVAQPNGQRWLRLGTGGIALAALVGMPLTAGFSSRAGLYARLLADGRWALLLVLALLHLPLIIAGMRLLLANDEASVAPETRHWHDWLREAAPVLTALGLLSVSNIIWSAVPLLVWLAILGTAAAGLVLSRLLGDTQPVRVMLRQALGAERPFVGTLPSFKALGSGVQTAVNDAADILDGDSGLLWLLLLAVIIILAG